MRTVDKAYLIDDKQNEMEQNSNQMDDKCELVIIERPEPPKVLKWMINSIIILMLATVITSTLGTMSLNILRSNFNWFNIFTAHVKFKPKPLNEFNNSTLMKLNSSDSTLASFTLNETKFIYEADYKVNIIDIKYLIQMEVDKSKTIWRVKSISDYLLEYPEVSEAIAIIWLIMTIIYQCGHKDANWGIPEGWRIVVPSIIIFFIMAMLTSIVTVLGNDAFNHFCTELKQKLIEPEYVRCGLAIHHLRLQRLSHDFNFDTVLNIYQRTNYAKAFCWLLSFIVILLRFLFAIDFQLIELKMLRYDERNITPKFTNRDSYESLPTDNDNELMSRNTIYNSTYIMPELNDSISKSIDSRTDNNKPHEKKNISYAEDEEIEDFQSASSIMVRSPLMGSGDYIHTQN